MQSDASDSLWQRDLPDRAGQRHQVRLTISARESDQADLQPVLDARKTVERAPRLPSAFTPTSAQPYEM
jgi:hypothetical protein